MKTINCLFALISISLLTACTVRPAPGTTLTLPNGVQVQATGSGVPGNGNFCPPGQAKKGRC